VTASTDPAGKTSTFLYDPALGTATKVTDPLGNATITSYDSLGRVERVTSPGGKSTATTHDAAGNPLTVTDPLGHVTTSRYDEDGNVVSVKQPPSPENPTGNVTTNDYDDRGLLIKTTLPDGLYREYTYDSLGRLRSERDTAGQVTTFTPDRLGRVTQTRDPLNRTVTSGYNAFGEATVVTDQAGETITTAYDSMGRLATVNYQDPATPDVTNAYDVVGRPLTSTASGVGTLTYTYDALGRLASVKDPNNRTVSYQRDARGLVTQIGYPTDATTPAASVVRTYDDAGRLTGVRDWRNKSFGFSYNADSQVIGITYPNGWTDTRTHDDGGRLSEITAKSGAQTTAVFTYDYDALDRITNETATLGSGPVTDTYGYDRQSRLVSWNNGTYAFDNQGNITKTADTPTLAYDAAGQLCHSGGATGACTPTPGGNTPYTFDQRGNRTVAGANTYGYDQASRLRSAPGGWTYRYDSTGTRSAKVNGATVTPFTWDRSGELPMLVMDATHRYVYGPWGSPLEQVAIADNTASYLIHDIRGSVRQLVSEAGTITHVHSFDPYGNTTTTQGTNTSPFGYAGEYTDSETGFQYLRARYYDPRTAQFISADPLVDITRAPFLYTSGAPNNRVDPSGEIFVAVVVVVVVVAIAAAPAVSATAGSQARTAEDRARDLLTKRYTELYPTCTPDEKVEAKRQSQVRRSMKNNSLYQRLRRDAQNNRNLQNATDPFGPTGINNLDPPAGWPAPHGGWPQPVRLPPNFWSALR